MTMSPSPSPPPPPPPTTHVGLMVQDPFDRFGSGSTTATTSPTGSSLDLTQLAIKSPGADAKADAAAGLDMPESRVLIIMTGGTICMVRSENGYVPATGFLDSCLRVRPSFNDGSPGRTVTLVNNEGKLEEVPTLRTPPSKYSRRIRYAALEFDPLLDSSSINAKGWGKIATAIQRNYQLFDAFIILHGTDSLAYTSSALSFMIDNLGKPVVLTGSQAPMTELHNDATDNLLGSLIIAGHYMIPEVCLFFNHRLFRGNRATKSNAHDFNAFSSPNHPALAKVGISTAVNWNYVRRPATISPFIIQTDVSTSHIACLKIFPGILPEMIKGVLKLPGLRGLVLETFGSGNAPEDARLIEVLREGIANGVVIVSVTQCQVGSVSPLYAAGTALARAGVVFGLDMTSEAALTKLASLLAQPALSFPEICQLMSTSIRGELTESAEMMFSHPVTGAEMLPPTLSVLSVLAYAIQKGDVKGVKAILKEGNGGKEKGWLVNLQDYAGNTALHLAAPTPHTTLITFFLSHGASVHLRNREGRTPLFLAAHAGRIGNVEILKGAGAHLHQDEREVARLYRKSAVLQRREGEVEAWRYAGV